MTTGNRLDSLEPHGAHIQLADLLRWRLAEDHVPLENRQSQALQSGGRRATLRGRGIDFEEVRLYQSGDDVRSIDWRVTARTGKPHTKIFREEKERPVLLLLDLRSSMQFGSRRCFKSVLAANAAALLAWTALAAGDRIGALLISDDGISDIKPQRSRHTVLQLFRQIIAIEQRQQLAGLRDSLRLEPPALLDAANQLRAIVKPGTCTILLSDFADWNERCASAMHPVLRHSQAFAIQIRDALEYQLPALGPVRLRDHLRRVAIDTGDKRLAARFGEHQQQRQAALQAALTRLKVPLLTLQTGSAILPTLRQFFGKPELAQPRNTSPAHGS